MVTIPLELNTEQIRGEKRVVFNHLSWLSYQQILQAIGKNIAPIYFMIVAL